MNAIKPVSNLKKQKCSVGFTQPSELVPMKISAYQAAMISMGNNVDEFEVVLPGAWIEDGEHLFKNTVFKNFNEKLYVLETIINDDGKLVRPWEKEVDCFPVKQMMTEDGAQFVELEDEEPIQ